MAMFSRVFKKKQDVEEVIPADEVAQSEQPAPAGNEAQEGAVSQPVASVAAPPVQDRAQSMDLFESLLAGMYDGLFIIDDKGYLIKSNERAREFFGYSEADIWNLNCNQLIPQLNAQVLYKIREHITQHRYTVVNAICQRQDGTSFPGEIAISSITMNNDTNMVLSIRNCERRNKTMHINRIRDKALKYAGVGILSCHPDGTIEYANPAFQKLIRATSLQNLLKCKLPDIFKKNEQCALLLESPTKLSSWCGGGTMTTMDDKELKVQVTSAWAEDHTSKGEKHSYIITASIMPGTVASIST